MEKEAVIQVINVKKYFKSVKAVDGIDLVIYGGEYLALLGPNGAGKTTLVEMIEGIQRPDSGEILVMGRGWRGNEEALHHMIGLSLQETRFFDKLTVGETFRLFASFYRLDFSRADEMIELVNLGEKRGSYVVNLSGGQRQKLALGISLLNFPRILLLDEPTTGLDPVARREIWEILKGLREEKKTTLILTTHYMDEAELLCDRIVIIDRGKIIAQGSLRELLSGFETSEIVEFQIGEDIPELGFPPCEAVKEVTWNGSDRTGRIVVTDILKFMPVFSSFIRANNHTLKAFQCRTMNLDNLFVSLTGRKLTE